MAPLQNGSNRICPDLLVRNGLGTYHFSIRNGGLMFSGTWVDNKLATYQSHENTWYRCSDNPYASYLFIGNAMYVRAGCDICKSDSFQYDQTSRRVTATVSNYEGRSWTYDFQFSTDFKAIESGYGREAPNLYEWQYRRGPRSEDTEGQLVFEYKADDINSAIFAQL